MKKCKRCGRKSFLFHLPLNKDGLCEYCARIIGREQEEADIERRKKEQAEKERLEKEAAERERAYMAWEARQRAEKVRIGSLSCQKIAQLLVEDAKYETGFGDRLEEYNRRKKEKQEKEQAKFDRVLALHKEAYDLEKQGKLEEAITLYLKNLKEHPDGTVYYERPCIALEKLGRYDEAINICNMALQRIRSGKMHANSDSFFKRIERLEKKRSKE